MTSADDCSPSNTRMYNNYFSVYEDKMCFYGLNEAILLSFYFQIYLLLVYLLLTWLIR